MELPYPPLTCRSPQPEPSSRKSPLETVVPQVGNTLFLIVVTEESEVEGGGKEDSNLLEGLDDGARQSIERVKKSLRGRVARATSTAVAPWRLSHSGGLSRSQTPLRRSEIQTEGPIVLQLPEVSDSKPRICLQTSNSSA
jgi:hypothetical protein